MRSMTEKPSGEICKIAHTIFRLYLRSSTKLFADNSPQRNSDTDDPYIDRIHKTMKPNFLNVHTT